MKSVLRLLYAFVISALCTFVLASILHTQFVIYRLTALGVEVPFWDRVRTTAEDILGMLPTYGIAIAVGLLVAFLITGLLRRFITNMQVWWYIVAGGVAMMTILLVMQPVLNVTLIAGSRGAFGFLAQCAAGLFGGWAFSRSMH